MIRLHKFIFLLLVLTLGFACKDGEIPEPMTGEPVFFFSGTINEEPITINAGDNDFFMFTEFESDDQNVYSYVARLAKLQPDCGDECEEQLRILIRHNEVGPPTADSVGIALDLERYEFDSEVTIEDTITKFVVQYDNKSISSSPFATYNWTLPEGGFIGETPPVDTLQQLGFNVGLEVREDSFAFCNSSIVRAITSNPNDNCAVGFDVFSNPTSTSIGITALPSGTGSFDYSWQNGIIDSATIFIDTIGQYCVTVTDAAGCLSTNCLEYVDDSVFGKVYCAAAFDYQLDQYQEIISSDPLRLSTVTIEYTDSRGTFYSSKLGAQPANSTFEIVSQMDFEDNENGQATKKITVNFNAFLYNENGMTLSINSNRSSFGVAYPN